MLKLVSSNVVRLFFALLVAVMLGWTEHREQLHAQYAALYLKNKNYRVQTEMYRTFRRRHADVVMLGNSITYNANWGELLGRPAIANRGISSDILPGYLHRMEFVTTLSPKLCFIEGGVNDIYENIPPHDVFENYVAVVDTLRAHGITPVVQSTLFVSARWHNAPEKNKEILVLDQLLAEFCLRERLEYLDINRLVSADGFLRDDLTFDGLHPNAQGYALWVPEVERVLVRHGF